MLKLGKNKQGFTPLDKENKIRFWFLCKKNLTDEIEVRLPVPEVGLRRHIDRKNLTGFTMIEMMVSLFIIAILTTVTLANYRSYGQQGNLNMAAQKLASDIRQAQSYALGLKDFNGVAPLGGWGVTIAKNKNFYKIFADVNGDEKFINNEKFGEDIELGKSIVASDFKVTGYSGVNRITITFVPPDPEVNICKNAPQCGYYGEITLTDGTNNKIISINKFGLVDVVN